MNTRKQALQEGIHFWIMRHLAENPSLSQPVLAKELGISLGCINVCLQALIDNSLVKALNLSASHCKLNYNYLLTPKGVAEKAILIALFLKRKLEEYEMLKPEIAQLHVTVNKADVIDSRQ